MKLSPYNKSKQSEVVQLVTKVFSDSEGPSEGILIGNLVVDLLNDTGHQDLFGFVATEKGTIVGAIFFTRLSFATPVEAFILSPAAIRTDYQGMGIGQLLITFGCDQLKEKGVELVFTYGDPHFYAKVGYEPIAEDMAKAPFALSRPEGWLCKSLNKKGIQPLSGRSRCVNALNKPEYW